MKCKTCLIVLVSASLVSCAYARTPRSANVNQPAVGGDTITELKTPAVSTGEPVPPSVFINTTYTRPQGRTIPVTANGDPARNFQTALDSAKPGDIISLQAGATFTGNFILPKKVGSESLVIRTSAPDDKLPPPGTRITPDYASLTPKLVSPNADAVIRTAPGAHHYRFIGIEFTTAPGWAKNHGLILLGDGGDAQNATSSVPHDLILDRCYIHGNADVNLRRAIALNSASTAIIDSYISDVHEAGADSQAICGWNGPGPFKIVNNYIEAAGENVMFGGADPRIPNLVPSDIEFRRNHCSKPLSWMAGDPSYGGKRWSVKNLFELKNARRVIIDGNLLENNWVEAQSGFAILLTVRNQDGTAPWSVIEDVTFINNILRHTAAGISLLGRDDNHSSEQLKRVLIRNNLFEDIGGKRWGRNGRFLQIAETVDVTVDHNTVLHSGNIITAYGAANQRFIFTNNIVPHNEYGVMGDGSGVGNATLDRYFPGRVFKKNVIIGGRSSSYPADNFFPAALDPVQGSYALNESSPYRNAGTDSKNIGCDFEALKAAMQLARPVRSISSILPGVKKTAMQVSTVWIR